MSVETSKWLQMQRSIATEVNFKLKQNEEEQNNKYMDYLVNKHIPLIKEIIEKSSRDGKMEVWITFDKDDFSRTLTGETVSYHNYELCLRFLQRIVASDDDLKGIRYIPEVSNIRFNAKFMWC